MQFTSFTGGISLGYLWLHFYDCVPLVGIKSLRLFSSLVVSLGHTNIFIRGFILSAGSIQ